MALFDPKMFKGGGEIVFPIGVRIDFSGYAHGNKIMYKVGKCSGIIPAWID